MWYKYQYSFKDILVLSSLDFIPSFEKNVKGGRYTSFVELLAGHTWESKEPYLIFTEIPTIIKENLICMNEELNMREHWNENDETVDLA